MLNAEIGVADVAMEVGQGIKLTATVGVLTLTEPGDDPSVLVGIVTTRAPCAGAPVGWMPRALCGRVPLFMDGEASLSVAGDVSISTAAIGCFEASSDAPVAIARTGAPAEAGVLVDVFMMPRAGSGSASSLQAAYDGGDTILLAANTPVSIIANDAAPQTFIDFLTDDGDSAAGSISKLSDTGLRLSSVASLDISTETGGITIEPMWPGAGVNQDGASVAINGAAGNGNGDGGDATLKAGPGGETGAGGSAVVRNDDGTTKLLINDSGMLLNSNGSTRLDLTDADESILASPNSSNLVRVGNSNFHVEIGASTPRIYADASLSSFVAPDGNTSLVLRNNELELTLDNTADGDLKFTADASGNIDIKPVTNKGTWIKSTDGNTRVGIQNNSAAIMSAQGGSDSVQVANGQVNIRISGSDILQCLAGVGQFFATIQNKVAGNEGTTVGAAGGASALPATPLGYLKVKINDGTTVVIPYYTAP